MSGIAEALTVIAVVAGLVSAFKDGGSIVDKIKQRRKLRNKPPPTFELEEVIADGENDIARTAEKGRQRFGDGFATGDAEAIQALQQVTIEVQASMLSHLRDAVRDDDMNDFEECIDNFIEARMKAVQTLNDLYRRQRDAGRRQSVIEPTTPSPVTRTSTSETITSTLGYGVPPTRHTAVDMQAQTTQPSQPSRRNTTDSTSSGSATLSVSLSRQSTQETLPFRDRGFFAPRRQRASIANPNAVAYLLDPNTRNPNRRISSSSSYPSTTTVPPPAQPAPASGRLSTSSLTNSSQSSLSLSTLPTQSPGNLCEGAYYVQATSSPVPSLPGHPPLLPAGFCLSSNKLYWKCRRTKCSFQGTARRLSFPPVSTPLERAGGAGYSYLYDDTARRAGPLRYRWLFLAKSHVVQDKKDFKRQFRCLVCRLTGDTKQGVLYAGDQPLMKHLERHAGQVSTGGVRLSGPVVFRHDRVVVGNESDFDVCFPVVSDVARAAGGGGRETGQEQPAELLSFSRASTQVEVDGGGGGDGGVRRGEGYEDLSSAWETWRFGGIAVDQQGTGMATAQTPDFNPWTSSRSTAT